MPDTSRAESLFNEANKTLHGGFFSFLSSSNRFEDAAELFTKSGNLFKSESDFYGAIRAFEGAYNAHLKTKNNYYASISAAEVGAQYSRLDDAENTEKWYLIATNLISDQRLNQAAKYLKILAEFYENLKNLEKSFFYFKKSENLFSIEKNDSSDARNCQIKMAILGAEMSNFSESRDLFLKVAKNCLQNNLLQFSARDYFLRAIFVDLAAGNLNFAKNDQVFAMKNDPRFANSREAKFIEKLIEATEKMDVKQFQQEIFEFDQIQNLDFWKIKMLNLAKEKIEKMEDMAILGEKEENDEDIL